MNPARAKALKSMLRPVARFWLRDSETLQSFIDVLKVAFVEVAVEEMIASDTKVNVSRISMMTGVHRIDAAAMYKRGQRPERALPDLLTRVLSTWEQDPLYQTSSGKPRSLTFEGSDSEFAELVEHVCRGVKPGTVLFELERAGSVQCSPRGAKIVRPSHRRSKDIERAMTILGRDIESLISAVSENVRSEDESPNLHARTEYDSVYVKDIPKIRAWLWREGRKFHKRARDFISKSDSDFSSRKGEEAGAKVSLSTFSFIEEAPPAMWSIDEAK